MSVFIKQDSPAKSFRGIRSLVNKQFQYKTLGEMVSMYKRTGEYPAVGTRNGVYFASGIDDEIPPRERFDILEAQRRNIEATSAAEEKLKSAEADKARADAQETAAKLKEFEELKKRASAPAKE